MIYQPEDVFLDNIQLLPSLKTSKTFLFVELFQTFLNLLTLSPSMKSKNIDQLDGILHNISKVYEIFVKS